MLFIGHNMTATSVRCHMPRRCALLHSTVCRLSFNPALCVALRVLCVWVCAVASLVGNLILMIEDFANATVRLLDLVGRLVVPNDAIS